MIAREPFKSVRIFGHNGRVQSDLPRRIGRKKGWNVCLTGSSLFPLGQRGAVSVRVVQQFNQPQNIGDADGAVAVDVDPIGR